MKCNGTTIAKALPYPGIRSHSFGGHRYSIYLVDWDCEELGACQPADGRIFVNRKQPPFSRRSTLIHEAIHAADLRLSEADVSNFEGLLTGDLGRFLRRLWKCKSSQ